MNKQKISGMAVKVTIPDVQKARAASFQKTSEKRNIMNKTKRVDPAEDNAKRSAEKLARIVNRVANKKMKEKCGEKCGIGIVKKPVAEKGITRELKDGNGRVIGVEPILTDEQKEQLKINREETSVFIRDVASKIPNGFMGELLNSSLKDVFQKNVLEDELNSLISKKREMADTITKNPELNEIFKKFSDRLRKRVSKIISKKINKLYKKVADKDIADEMMGIVLRSFFITDNGMESLFISDLEKKIKETTKKLSDVMSEEREIIDIPRVAREDLRTDISEFRGGISREEARDNPPLVGDEFFVQNPKKVNNEYSKELENRGQLPTA